MTKENEERNRTEGKDSASGCEKCKEKCWEFLKKCREKFWEIVEMYWKCCLAISIIIIIISISIMIWIDKNLSPLSLYRVLGILGILGGIWGLIIACIGRERKKQKEEIQEKEKKFKEHYENLLQDYKDTNIFIEDNELKEISFKENLTTEYRNEAIQNFRKEMNNSEIGPRQLRRIILWLEEASDLCDVSEANTEVVVTPIYISFLAIVVAVLLGVLDRIGNSQIEIVLSVGISVPLLVVVVPIMSLGYEKRKTQEFNEYLQWRNMLLQAAKREVEARLLELEEEERKQKELEEEKKRCEQRACEDKVLKSTTQIKILEKEILRIDSEKGFFEK